MFWAWHCAVPYFCSARLSSLSLLGLTPTAILFGYTRSVPERLRQHGVNELAQDSKQRRWDSNPGPALLPTRPPRPSARLPCLDFSVQIQLTQDFVSVFLIDPGLPIRHPLFYEFTAVGWRLFTLLSCSNTQATTASFKYINQ